MKKLFLLTALLGFSFAEAAELKFYLDGESRKYPDVVYFASGIRQVPGRFGKGLLIERRTVNFFTGGDLILSDGAKLAGKDNKLTLPAEGYAALPLTAIRPKSVNTLSFQYKGEGKITVSFGGKTLAAFEAGKEFKRKRARHKQKNESIDLLFFIRKHLIFTIFSVLKYQNNDIQLE